MKGKVIDSLADLKQLTASQGNVDPIMASVTNTTIPLTDDVLSPISYPLDKTFNN